MKNLNGIQSALNQCTWKVDMHDDPISAADIAVISSKSAWFPSRLGVKLFQSEREMAPFYKKIYE